MTHTTEKAQQHKKQQNTVLSTVAGLIAILLTLVTQPATAAELYFIHNDHLGTPQVVTDQNQNIVWRGRQQPFGETTEETATINQNARFPGQYLDEETGLHYNYFRDYDPTTGRYIQSDPIGLEGGPNIYGYAEQNPIVNIDPDGLLSVKACANPANAAACAAAGILPKLPKIKKPKKPRQPGTVTCNCRAIENQHCKDGSNQAPRTAFGTATARKLKTAQSQAKAKAKRKLGAQAKHDGCTCVDSKGKVIFTKGG